MFSDSFTSMGVVIYGKYSSYLDDEHESIQRQRNKNDTVIH